MVTCHSKMLLSSTSPAENPSTGFLVSSVCIGPWAGWCMVSHVSSNELHQYLCIYKAHTIALTFQLLV